MLESWKQVQTLIEELRPFLLKSGVPARQVSMPIADPNAITAVKYTEIYDWLHQFKMSPEMEGVLKVWRLLSPEIWARYDLHEVTGLQEQILLEKALAKLRKRWKLNRPSFFGRKFCVEEPESEGTEENSGKLRERPASDAV